MVGSISGFTLVELIVVAAIAGILVVLAVLGYNHYRDQYAFSEAVRGLTQAITVARVRAIQSQTTSRLLIRPQQGAPVAYWTNNYQYNPGDIVQYSPFTYRCITIHTSDTITTEPAVGTTWWTYWEIISDYQYNTLLVDVQHCAAEPGRPATLATVHD